MTECADPTALWTTRDFQSRFEPAHRSCMHATMRHFNSRFSFDYFCNLPSRLIIMRSTRSKKQIV